MQGMTFGATLEYVLVTKKLVLFNRRVSIYYGGFLKCPWEVLSEAKLSKPYRKKLVKEEVSTLSMPLPLEIKQKNAREVKEDKKWVDEVLNKVIFAK